MTNFRAIGARSLALVAAIAALLAARASGAAPPERGARLVAASECSRCHAVTSIAGLTPPPRDRSCAGCHAWIHSTAGDDRARAIQAETFPRWDEYVAHVRSYLAVPDLATVARLDPRWVTQFLRAPYKIRPALAESMIRTSLSEGDAATIADWLRARVVPLTGIAAAAAAIPPSAHAEDVAAGAQLYERLRCAQCHAFGARAATPGLPAAPDLAHTRDRMRAGDIAAFVADPTSLSGGGAVTMPSYGLSAADAARLRDFLLAAPLAPPTPTPSRMTTAPATLLPVLARPVGWSEVNREVFSAICTHCHSDGKSTRGDGGPGNTGGLGYAGSGLDLGSWRGLSRGARGPDGRRVSVLTPAPGQTTPRLLARLLTRVEEHDAELTGHGRPPGAAPGMPLGQPPLDPVRLQLVRTWLAQGAPGP